MPGIIIRQRENSMKTNLWKIASATASWSSWAVRNLLILPAGMLFLLIGLLFIHDKTTPGQFIVDVIRNADAVTDGVQWKWNECKPVQKVPDREDTDNAKTITPPPASVLAEKCPEVVTDGAGYASYIDRTMIRLLGMLWVIFAFICIGMSYLLRNYPHVAFPNVKRKSHTYFPQCLGSDMRTITTREQLLVNGKVRERVATHIVTGAHGYETLCTSGYNLSYNDREEMIENCEKLGEDNLPITCPTCYVVWQDVHKFKPSDFDTESGKGLFTDTGQAEITIVR